MAERRQATRREPIEIEVEDGRVFVAHPLPWTQATDFGNEVMRQNQEAANEFIQLYVNDGGLPQLELKFAQKISDWNTLLKIAFPDVPEEVWSTPRILSGDECADLALAACDVNHLPHLKALIDPNLPTPMTTGGKDSSGVITTTDGQKTESTPDSSSVDSAENPPSV